MAEKRYQFFAIVDKPNHPDEPQRKPRRTTYVYKNTTGGTDPKTGEIIRAECKGIDPSSNGIYTVDMESADANLKLMALQKAVKEGIDSLIGPYNTMAEVVIEQKKRQPLTLAEQLARANARIKEMEEASKVKKIQGER